MVEHLTFEELLQFNAMTYKEARGSVLSARVSTHVRDCAECRAVLAVMQSAEDRISAAEKASTVTAKKEMKRLF
ncbi:MAG: hypothetical protein IJF05_00505 [Clostridia bacterium]|nr:hypothetical protein [Clostridia bacterium]